MATDDLHLAFMYGTLKRGEANHSVLFSRDPSGVKFLGQGQTSDLYPLIVTTPFNIPFLLTKVGTGKKVEGEIYEINSTTLQLLDEFEGHPDFYERRKVKVEQITDGSDNLLTDKTKSVEVWLYALPRFKASLLDLPHLSAYRNDGVTVPKYRPYSPDTDGPLDDYLREI